MGKLLAPAEATYNFTCFCLSDAWIDCYQKTSLIAEVLKRTRDMEGEFAEEDDCESEYSEDEEDNKRGLKKKLTRRKLVLKSQDRMKIKKHKRSLSLIRDTIVFFAFKAYTVTLKRLPLLV